MAWPIGLSGQAGPGSGAGAVVQGAASWFGGPHDHTDSGHTALGNTTATPGIAVYNQSTLGGYWLVEMAGKKVLLQQTDIGPSPSTGKAVDVTYSALSAFGFTEQNFPTGGRIKATYLGKNKQQAVNQAGAMAAGFNSGIEGQAVADAAGAVSDAASQAASISDLVDVVRGFFDVLTNPQAWLRFGEAIVGSLLVYEGLRGLTGQGPGITEVAGAVTGGAAKVGAK